MNVISDVSSSPKINTVEAISKSKDILDDIIQVDNSSHVLTEETGR